MPRLHSLEQYLTCPECGRRSHRQDPDIYRGAMTCVKSCGVHWWATRLKAGNVRAQLTEHFDGDSELVAQLMDRFQLPEWIERSMFWQIQLDGSQWYRFNNDREIPGRSTMLLRGIVRRAS